MGLALLKGTVLVALSGKGTEMTEPGQQAGRGGGSLPMRLLFFSISSFPKALRLASWGTGGAVRTRLDVHKNITMSYYVFLWQAGVVSGWIAAWALICFYRNGTGGRSCLSFLRAHKIWPFPWGALGS